MDKERLEEIKKRLNALRELSNIFEKITPTKEFFSDIDWIIQQVECVEEQQKEIEKLQQIRKNVANAHQDNMQKINSENARLREALEFYADMISYSYDKYGSPIDRDYGEKARQALEES